MTRDKLIAAVRRHKGKVSAQIWLPSGNCLWVTVIKADFVFALQCDFEPGAETGLTLLDDGSVDTVDE